MSYFLEVVDIEEVLVSNKILLVKNHKYLLVYFYNDYKVKPLYVMIPKTARM